MTTMQRRTRNRITRLCIGNDSWVEDEEQIGNHFAQFYNDLFSTLGSRNFSSVLDGLECSISTNDNISLMQEISFEEVKLAVFELGSTKAPGPDGFTGAFYQKAWDTVGDQVCSLIKKFFTIGFSLEDINDTDMVLIPKKACPETINDYRPISLCNFSYKIFSKVLANRMKPYLDRFIAENQRAFVPGRLIQDNLIIVHEIFHHMKNKRTGSPELALKLDMNKAFDRNEWDFLCAVLRKIGFCDEWIQRILWCINSVSFSVMLSGKRLNTILPKCGLRQGDPLSPYLFIIVCNVLSSMIIRDENAGLLSGIKVARNGPRITHSLFADDSVIFLEADLYYCRRFKSILDQYCEASGQLVNFSKSCLYFSRNTDPLLKEDIGHIFQVFATDLPGKYLGLPIIWERSKKNSLNFVVDKVKKKIQGWEQNFLSDAGRENPNQIWAKLLKAKYFPKCSFMEAQKGGRASWLWSSIIEGRKILQGNVLSSVGNGESICVWNDPWIPSLPGKILLEFWDANSPPIILSSQGPHSGFSTSLKKWKPSDPDWLKINTDAAFNEAFEEAAIAFTVRDSSGWLLDGSSQIVSSSSSLHSECLALEAAVAFAKENDLHNISFETDCKLLVNYLTIADSIPDWTCDVIIDNIPTSGAYIRNHSFQWIPREANAVADWIAKASLSRSCPPDWTIRPPPPLEHLITLDSALEDHNDGG